MSNAKRRFESTLHYGKQLWYVPFTWLLTWNLYMIWHSIFVKNMSWAEVNALDYLGAVVSIVALAIAVFTLRAKIHKKFGVLGTRVLIGVKRVSSSHTIKENNTNQTQSLPEKLVQHIEVETKQLKPHVKPQSTIERNWVKKQDLETSKPVPAIQKANAMSTRDNPSVQSQKSQDIDSECLTCASLLNCNYRRERLVQKNVSSQKISCCPHKKEL